MQTVYVESEVFCVGNFSTLLVDAADVSTGSDVSPSSIRVAPVSMAYWNPIYRVNRAWLALFIIATT